MCFCLTCAPETKFPMSSGTLFSRYEQVNRVVLAVKVIPTLMINTNNLLELLIVYKNWRTDQTNSWKKNLVRANKYKIQEIPGGVEKCAAIYSLFVHSFLYSCYYHLYK